VGFDGDLIGPRFERVEPACLLAIFEQRIVLAAGLLPRAGYELDQGLAPVFSSFRQTVLTAFGCGWRRSADSLLLGSLA
jgi:hypothetical protein